MRAVPKMLWVALVGLVAAGLGGITADELPPLRLEHSNGGVRLPFVPVGGNSKTTF